MILADQMGRVGVATAKQRDIIAVLADRNRQAAGEPCYSGKVPALREAFRRTFEGAVEGKGPAVAEYEIVSDVERSEEHTSELQSQSNLVCRLLLEIKTVAISTLSQFPHVGFHNQTDNLIDLLHDTLSFRMQGVEVDNGYMHLDGHHAGSKVSYQFV